MEKIEWKGGECPVSGGTLVRLWFSGGDVEEEYAGERIWEHHFDHCGRNIIAYEVIEESKEPKPIIEKTLWDEYAIAWMSSGDWSGMTPEEAMGECVKVADAMMKARTK